MLRKWLSLIALLAFVTTGAFAHGGGSDGERGPGLNELLAKVRRATLPFHDVAAAMAAQYVEFKDAAGIACIAQPGQGAMGTHYVNLSLVVGDVLLDPLRPEALIYEHGAHGKLELVGVEYIVDQRLWDASNPQPPQLFGHPFHLVRDGNRYGIPGFYELHLWLWKHNRNGLFNDWNPDVHCH